MSKIKEKKEKVRRISQIAVINSFVAGIDVHDTQMTVAIPINKDEVMILSFGCFTRDLHAIIACLKKYHITSVSMESTGVYWIPLFLLLQENGIEVLLVNSKHVKNVTGRKEDEGDAEWIQKLHSCGLLRGSFQPDNMTRTLRSMVRHRKNLVRTSSIYVNRILKALELMNIKLQTVISDIDGKTGSRIIEAILSGERNPEKLADYRDSRIKASREEIIKSLEGYWTKEHLFELKQCYKLFLTHRRMIDECDKEIEKHLLEQIVNKNKGLLPELKQIKRKVGCKNKMQFNATTYLNELLGVNVTEITGISELSALTIMSEVGLDMTKWKTEHHFTSWLGIAPNTKKSNEKVISSKIMKKKQYAGQAFRMAASSLYGSKTPLGDYYRRIRIKTGGAKAVVATARKLAIIYYKMVKDKEAYNPKALIEFQQKYKEKKIQQLKKRIAILEAA